MCFLYAAAGNTDVTFDVIREVHGFYNDAWTSLLWATGTAIIIILAMVGLIGLLFPYLLDRARKRDFQLSRERILRQIDETSKNATDRIETARTMFQENLKVTLERIHATEQSLTQQISTLRAERTQHEAYTALEGNHTLRAFKCCLEAIVHGLRGTPDAYISPLATAALCAKNLSPDIIARDNYAVTKLREAVSGLKRIPGEDENDLFRELQDLLSAVEGYSSTENTSQPPNGGVESP